MKPNLYLMKNKLCCLITGLAVLVAPSHLPAQGTTFTYQGRLVDGGSPATGLYDLRFGLYDAASIGAQQGYLLTNSTTAVSNGQFTVTLDFGNQFPGADRWLEISVRTNGGDAFTALNPRQPLTATPYAITAGAVTGPVAAGQLTGAVPVSQVSGVLPLDQLPPAVVTNGASGVHLTGAFTGNASGLTNLAAANLVGAIADAQLSGNIPRLNVPNTTAVAMAVPTVNSGFITSANVTSGGSGYLTPPLVTATDATGRGAVLTAVVSGGSVTGLNVANPGSNYSGSASLTIAPPPSTAFQTFVTPNFFSGVNTMTNADNKFAGSFAGNAAGLTNLPPAGLTGVLAPAQIPSLDASKITSGTLAPALIPVLDAATSLTGTLPDARLTANVALRNGPNDFTGLNQFAGLVRATNVGNQFAGNVSGNGAGLTNLPATSLTGALAPAQIPSLNASKITSGTFATALIPVLDAATNLTGILPDARLTTNVALRTSPNDFTGLNQFAGVVRATNVGNQFVGSVSGNGAGLTNIPASAFAAAPPGMVLIPAGAFTMGDTLDGLSDAVPTNVTVSAFYLDVNLVSWSQWQAVYFWATNHGYVFSVPGAGNAANHPVQAVNWYDCVKWCNARSQQAGKPPVYYTDAGWAQVYTNGEPTTVYANWAASGYRLPTEAEWEKAARGGVSGQRFPWGNVINQNLGNYYGDTASYGYDLGPDGYSAAFTNGVTTYTSPLGSFAANAYGLNDMAGNVFEWCWDWYGTSYAGGSDPRGPAGSLSFRVLRGGAWNYDASYARCAYRNYFSPSYAFDSFGFRCVRGL